MKRFASVLVLCGMGSAASAWSLFGVGVMAHRAAVDADAAMAPAPCVGNFSKDGCEGAVEPGLYETLGCNFTDCKTIRVSGAVYKTRMKSSGLLCGTATGACASKCDEFEDGDLTMKFDYILRADSCCPYRGSWVGKWEYVSDSGRVFGGEAHGTLGVGTNRTSQCDIAGDKCESCYDVQSVGHQWLIGWEGSFRGVAANSSFPQPELNFTMDGTWAVSQDVREPFRQKFRVFNRFDGAWITYCQ